MVLLPHRQRLRLGEGQTVEGDDRDLLPLPGSFPRDEGEIFGNIFVRRIFCVTVFVFSIVVVVVVIVVVVVEVVVAEV